MQDEITQGTVIAYQDHRPDIDRSVFIAPNACVIGKVTIKANTSIWFNAVLRADEVSIRIGSRTNIQDGVIIHGDAGQDVEIGNNVTIGHGAIIHGCVIEEGALIGMGAVVLDGALIERGALVAAGAVVSPGKRVSANTLWAGVPAKYIRDLDAKSTASLLESAEHYTQQSRVYQSAAVGLVKNGAKEMKEMREMKEKIPKQGAWFAIDQARINHFADVTQDHQYIHIDPTRAKETDLGGTIAHGFLSLSLLPKLAEGCLSVPDNSVMGINYGFDKVRFLNPVRPGDEIRCCARVIDQQDKGEGRYLQKMAVTVEIKGQEKPALVCDWLNLFVCDE